jgi:hypothetical protein
MIFPSPAVHGSWSSWEVGDPPGFCSEVCSGGTRVNRIRHCDNPGPLHGGDNCPLSDGTSRALLEHEIEPCNTHDCKGELGSFYL